MKTFVIDDDQISLFLAKNILRVEGFSDDIHIFFSAETALDWFAKASEEAWPNFIFLDLNMPGMSGWEFLMALSPWASRLAGKCHIYILTSSYDPADLEQVDAYPAVEGLIHKPLSGADLHLILAQHGGPSPDQS